jgi:hypothetical protein
MSRRSGERKTGPLGQQWVSAVLKEHPDWRGRGFDDNDPQAELIGRGGGILKLRISASEHVRRREAQVEIFLDGKHIAYARSCRDPVVLVRVETSSRQGWYLWLQPWILERRAAGNRLDDPKTGYTAWVEEARTFAYGLDLPLKEVAAWKGEAQRVFALLDALRAAAAGQDGGLTAEVLALLVKAAPDLGDVSINAIVQEAEGILASGQLLSLVRALGPRLSAPSVGAVVRARLDALGTLYDEHFEPMAALHLPDHFLKGGSPELAYYCALREANPEKQSPDFLVGAGDFVFAGLRFRLPQNRDFWDEYARRGVSAILDALIPEGVG